MLLADYRSYLDCQEKVAQAYQDQENWTRMSILNVARMGYFSSDRSIREYCRTDLEDLPGFHRTRRLEGRLRNRKFLLDNPTKILLHLVG